MGFNSAFKGLKFVVQIHYIEMELCTAKLLWVTDTHPTFFTRVCETSHVAREIPSIVQHSTNSPTIITNRGFPAQSSEHSRIQGC